MPKAFIDRSGKASVDALTNGQVQVANIFSTTPWIAVNGFVTLDDPKLLFGSDNVVPLMRKDKVTDTITNTLNAVSAKLDHPDPHRPAQADRHRQEGRQGRRQGLPHQ